MRRVLLLVPSVLLLSLAWATSAALACHNGGFGCPPPEQAPFNPRFEGSVEDNRVNAPSNLTATVTQEDHEQYPVTVDIDFPGAWQVDLDVPAAAERIADIVLLAVTGPTREELTLLGRIEDHNDHAGHPSGGVYHWLGVVELSTGDVELDIFVDRNAADGHLHIDFDVPQEIIDAAKAVDGSLLRLDVQMFGRMTAGDLLRNPLQAGTYAFNARIASEHGVVVTPSGDVQIVDRVPQAVTVSPDTARREVGESYTATVAALDQAGEPLVGADVDVDVPSGPHQGNKCANLVTDANGRAQCTYTELTPSGNDTVRATVTAGGQSASDTAAVDWDKATTLTLEPATATRTVGQTHTVTATLKDDEGQPMQGETVDFDVSSGPNAGDSGTGTTDADGRAQFAYAGDGGEGTDTIEASSNLLSASATVEWRAVPPLVPTTISMTPENVTFNAYMESTTVEFTALVRDQNGQPLPGVQVHFEVISGPNAGDVSGDRDTGSDGRARFAYTGLKSNGEGVDTLEARVTGSALRDTSTVRWDTDPCEGGEPDDVNQVVHTGISGVFFRPDLEFNLFGTHTEIGGCVTK